MVAAAVMYVAAMAALTGVGMMKILDRWFT